jgi:hypothetical protein
MTKCTYLANKVLDYVFGKQAFTPPDTLYAGLCTGVTDAGVITGEPSSGGYARVAIDNNDVTTIWSAAASKQKSNGSGAIVFPAVTATWGTLTVFFISDAASGNTNTWCYGSLVSSITPGIGVAPTVAVGNLVESIV